jgi:hypothetical protein
MTQPDIWYVTFGPDKTIKSDDQATGTIRSTRTFKAETDAKLFALQVLAKGYSVNAGTLNPYQPRRSIPTSQIESWADPTVGASKRVEDGMIGDKRLGS